MTINNVEFWEPVIGYEKLYEISSQGRIRSTFNRRVQIQMEKR